MRSVCLARYAARSVGFTAVPVIHGTDAVATTTTCLRAAHNPTWCPLRCSCPTVALPLGHALIKARPQVRRDTVQNIESRMKPVEVTGWPALSTRGIVGAGLGSAGGRGCIEAPARFSQTADPTVLHIALVPPLLHLRQRCVGTSNISRRRRSHPRHPHPESFSSASSVEGSHTRGA